MTQDRKQYSTRRANDDDARKIVGFWENIRRESGGSDDQLVAGWQARLEDYVRTQMQAGSAAFWLAEVGGSVSAASVFCSRTIFPSF